MKYLLPLLLITLFPVWSLANPRTALVIGNSNYELMPLTNPENDAEDMAKKLETLGFEVILGKNENKAEFKQLIRDFGRKLKQKGGVGLFFYAGHGLQMEGKNYLIPVDFHVSAAYEVPDAAVNADLIIGAMEEATNPMNIILLDACRDNPFPRKTRSGARGLARMDSASGTIIAYSTSPGDVAADGEGRNSPYTSNLLKYIATPGLTIEQVFKRVRVGVEDATKGRQLPWETSSLRGDFYFNSPPQGNPVVPLSQPLSAKVAKKHSTQPQPEQKISHRMTDIANGKRLTIFTNPDNSQVTLLNSSVHYSPGVRLKPGDYRIEVSKEGYRTTKKWITIDDDIEDDNVELLVTLVPG